MNFITFEGLLGETVRGAVRLTVAAGRIAYAGSGAGNA